MVYENTKNDISVAGLNNATFICSRLPDIVFNLKNLTIPSLTAAPTTMPLPHLAQFSIPATVIEDDEITINFVVDERFKNYFSINAWMKENLKCVLHKDMLSDGNILILNNHKNPIIRIKLVDIYPSMLSEINFDFTLPDPIIAYASFKCHYYEVEYL